MRKLFSILLGVAMSVVLTTTALAGVANVGSYRPNGIAGVEGYKNYESWYESYDADTLINIAYIDSYSIIATKGSDVMTFTCDDPINYPNTYMYHYNNSTIPLYYLVTSDEDPGIFMFIINAYTMGNMYYYTMRQYK